MVRLRPITPNRPIPPEPREPRPPKSRRRQIGKASNKGAVNGAGSEPGSGVRTTGRGTRVWSAWRCKCPIQRGTQFPLPRSYPNGSYSRADQSISTTTRSTPQILPGLGAIHLGPRHPATRSLAGWPETSSRDYGGDQGCGWLGGDGITPRPNVVHAPAPRGPQWKWPRQCGQIQGETCRWTDGRSHPNPAGTG